MKENFFIFSAVKGIKKLYRKDVKNKFRAVDIIEFYDRKMVSRVPVKGRLTANHWRKLMRSSRVASSSL